MSYITKAKHLARCLGGATLALTVCASSAATSPTQTTLPAAGRVQEQLGALAVPFEENRGQFDARVAFAARTFTGQLYVTRDGRVVHSLLGPALDAVDAAEERGPARRAVVRRGAGWALIEAPVRALKLGDTQVLDVDGKPAAR